VGSSLVALVLRCRHVSVSSCAFSSTWAWGVVWAFGVPRAEERPRKQGASS
jgi:hypothetical protein